MVYNGILGTQILKIFRGMPPDPLAGLQRGFRPLETPPLRTQLRACVSCQSAGNCLQITFYIFFLFFSIATLCALC